jgi:AraC family transcriptional regulator
MELNIKNMVCGRCLKIVRQVAEEMHLHVQLAELGKLTVKEDLTKEQLAQLRQALVAEGFDLIDDQKAKLVEQIRNLIIQKIQEAELDEMKENFSDYLSSHLFRDYNYLSNLFSSLENTTIEQFIILQKTEKVKELLVYNEMPLNEIAFRLGYSSQAHLSAQFKKITGFTPLQFKKLKDHHRNHLDKV